jgi:hypothetical protein
MHHHGFSTAFMPLSFFSSTIFHMFGFGFRLPVTSSLPWHVTVFLFFPFGGFRMNESTNKRSRPSPSSPPILAATSSIPSLYFLS